MNEKTPVDGFKEVEALIPGFPQSLRPKTEAERELIARVQIKTLTEECLYILNVSEVGEWVWPEKYGYLPQEDEMCIDDVEMRVRHYLKTFLALNEEGTLEEISKHAMKNLEEILCIPERMVYPSAYYHLIERLQGTITRICALVPQTDVKFPPLPYTSF